MEKDSSGMVLYTTVIQCLQEAKNAVLFSLRRAFDITLNTNRLANKAWIWRSSGANVNVEGSIPLVMLATSFQC
jgi:hypothetical protein